MKKLRWIVALLAIGCAPAPEFSMNGGSAMTTSSSNPTLDRHALVIGNGGYRAASNLANAINDASDVAATLERLGFKVTLVLDLDSQSMNAAIGEFAGSLPESALVLFYFAGHGLQIDRENYILATDAGVETIDNVSRMGSGSPPLWSA